ncbi:UDP-glucosyltransferase 2-like [Neodiprion fabricii]|uniref:UDP-glucosyltransferase 2-like n=1 Tax=Neodiprion fabricii TaxID=2872261 RepID=UPI001ED8ECB7|nr:UDP-glucosyltransferase 2-like [Neodiprion fabricii]
MKYLCKLLLIVFCLLSSTRHVNSARILAVFPLDTTSHFIMFDVVVKSLADAGHQVDVYSHFAQKRAYPNYTHTSIGDISQTTAKLGLTYDFIHGYTDTKDALIELAGNMGCQLLGHPEMQKLIRNPPTNPPYDLVITESFYGSCWYAFGRHLKVPLVALSSRSLVTFSNAPIGNPQNTAFVSEITDGSILYMNFWQRFKNTFSALWRNHEFNYHTEVQSDIVKKYFGPHMPGVRELEKDVALILVNSHHVLSGIRPLTPAVVDIGGIHVSDDDTALPTDLGKWLDDSRHGFIYFTFGSMIRIESFPKAMLAELYAGFAKIAPVRVLMRILAPEDLPPNMPDNVLTMRWVPQIKVLKHKNIRAFVTQGGVLSLQEALIFAVPIIGIPILADQPVNVKNCVERKIAVMLDYKTLTAEKFVEAVNATIYDPRYKQNVVAASEKFLDRPLNARDTAVYWIEYILRHGGDSLRSPALKLTWWQVALLDVYGCIFTAVLTVLYLARLILSALLRQIICVAKKIPTSKKTN